MEHPHKLVFTTHIPMRWGDMDAMGHVNNTLYFRYAEQARTEWIASMSLIEPGASVLINASCTFLIPLTYPGTVEARIYLGRPGRSSIQTYYDLRPVGDERIYAEGSAKIVCTDPATGKSAPLPEGLRRMAE